jgi:multidrug resistance efflux pump
MATLEATPQQKPVMLPSLRLAKSSRSARTLGRILMVMLLAGMALVVVAPWQQTVGGKGNVIAYAPLERQQTVQAAIKGRIIRWGEGIFENAHVKEGDLIAEIQDLDVNYLGRLKDQLAQANDKVAFARNELQATEKQREAAEEIVRSYERQVDVMISARDSTIAAADEFVKAAVSKYESELQKVVEVEALLAQDEADYNRQSRLFEDKVVSEQKLQQAEQKYKSAKAKVEVAKRNIDAAKSEYEGKQRERDAKAQEAQAKIDQVRAYLDKARQDVSKVDSDIAKAEKGYTESEKELIDTEIKVDRQENQLVRAPRSGFILRLMAATDGQLVKEGDPLCVIVPDTADRAVQVWVKGVDAPLVTAGSHVRLQFEGWPAVQFTGWPSIAVGTFGGKVVSVDSTDNGKGEFRVLVLPELAKGDVKWPSDQYLRQGVRANGFILLKTVPLWYEIWRKMNGFPPSLTSPETEGKPEKKGEK